MNVCRLLVLENRKSEVGSRKNPKYGEFKVVSMTNIVGHHSATYAISLEKLEVTLLESTSPQGLFWRESSIHPFS